MRVHVINEAGVVVNTVLAESVDTAPCPPGRRVVEATEGGPGWVHDPGTGVLSAPPTDPPPPPTEADVRAEAARRLAILGQPYSPEERETWPIQVLEAAALAVDPGAEVPMLAVLAAGRGQTVGDLAVTVRVKDAAFRAASAAILGAQAVLLVQDPIPADYTTDAHWP